MGLVRPTEGAIACSLGRSALLLARRGAAAGAGGIVPPTDVAALAARQFQARVEGAAPGKGLDLLVVAIPGGGPEAAAPFRPAAASLAASLADLFAALGCPGREVEGAVALLFETVAPMFGLDRDRAFAAEAAALAERLSAGPPVGLVPLRDAGVVLLDARGAGAFPVGAAAFLPGERLALGRVAAAADEAGRLAPAGPLAALSGIAGAGGARHAVIVREGRARAFALDAAPPADAAALAGGPRPGLVPLALAAAGPDGSRRLAAALRPVRLPAAPAHDPAAEVALKPTLAARTAAGLFLAGWLHDPAGRIREVRLAGAPAGAPPLQALWHTAPGLAEIGGRTVPTRRFAVHLPPEAAPSPALAQPELVVALDDGRALLARPGPPPDGLAALRSAILAVVDERHMGPAAFRDAFLPPVEALTAALAARQRIESVTDHGPAVRAELSIVVPLYGTLQYLRPQMLAFAADARLKARAEIVYVVDDPTLAEAAAAEVSGLAPLFGLAVRLVRLAVNGGYALACNLGAAAARGRRLVLMNSDVVPLSPGWTEPLERVLARRRRAAVVGPRLLYPDGSLQHAGLHFAPHLGWTWQNLHYFKGFSGEFAPALVERRVPAVTGALMVLDRAAFEDVGGFTTAYVVGDYEDSDLCLKLAARGGQSWYAPAAALMHVERQSVPLSREHTDEGAAAFNRALHAHLWSDAIAALMRAVPPPPGIGGEAAP